MYIEFPLYLLSSPSSVRTAANMAIEIQFGTPISKPFNSLQQNGQGTIYSNELRYVCSQFTFVIWQL